MPRRMADIVSIRRALISVSDKTGLVAFARALAASGVEILSTGGSACALREAGIAAKDVSEHTGFPEILDGRVKTLVPQIHGGILGRRDLAEHAAQMQEHGIAPIDLVAVNLYPFEATVAMGAASEECMENIDIGGPALIRAAAKNHEFVAVLIEPEQYQAVLDELSRHGGTTLALRRRLASAAFARTAAYDSAIAGWFAAQQHEPLPRRLTIAGTLRQTLRYGENPHQQAGFFVTNGRPGVATAAQAQGKELSYNNLNDTDAAFECVAEFEEPAVVIVKHGNPCGVALGATLASAWDKALRCDPVSAFGGIVAVNRPLDGPAAEKIAAIFTEVIAAPEADEAARAILAGKKNLRLLLTGSLPDPAVPGITFRSVAGGFLAQTRELGPDRGRRAASGDEAGAHQDGVGGPGFRVPSLQAREVERDRLRQGRCDRWNRSGADEPGRFHPDRHLEERRSSESGGYGRAAGQRRRGRLRRVLPFRRRARGGSSRGRNGRDPARRLNSRFGGDCCGGRSRDRNGVRRDSAFPALSGLRRLGRRANPDFRAAMTRPRPG